MALYLCIFNRYHIDSILEHESTGPETPNFFDGSVAAT